VTIQNPQGSGREETGVDLCIEELTVKLLFEILLAIFLHPVATILTWVNLLGRSDIGRGRKVIWAIIALIPIGPILYVLVGDGAFW
jgi:hypothetical protein